MGSQRRSGTYREIAIGLILLLAWQAHAARADDRAQYFRVAEYFSYDYGGKGGRLNTPSLATVEAIEKKATDVAVQRAAEVVAFALQAEEAKRESIERSIADSKETAKEMLRSGSGGRHTETYIDRDEFTGKLESKTIEVRDGDWSQRYSQAVLAGPDGFTAGQVELRRQIAFLGALTRAWEEMLPGTPAKFAGPPSRKPLVQVEYRGDPEAPARYGDTFSGRHFAINVAKRDLHHVTMLVEMFHYSTLDDPCARQIYFLPKWNKGDSIELSRHFMLDFKRGGRNYSVMTGAKAPNERQLSELTQLAGVARMRVTVWADEASQEAQLVDVSERAMVVSGELVKVAESVMMSPYAVTSDRVRSQSPNSRDNIRNRKAPIKESSAKEPRESSAEEKTKKILECLLNPVVELLPADSELARHANRLLSDFKGERDRMFGRDDQEMLDACAEGRQYIEIPTGPRHPLGLLFVSRDEQGKKIWAELFDSTNPQTRRKLRGELGRDPRTQKVLLLLQPPSDRLHQLGSWASLKDAELLSDEMRTYSLTFENGQFLGSASSEDVQFARFDLDSQKFHLKPAESDADALTEAKERQKAPPREGKTASERGSPYPTQNKNQGAGRSSQPNAGRTTTIPGRPPMPNRRPTSR